MPLYRRDAGTVVDGITATPQNSIECFEPEEFPFRRPRNYTQHDIGHMMELEQLEHVRHDVSRYGFRSCYILGSLEKVLLRYTHSAFAAGEQLQGYYEREVQGIEETSAAQMAEIAAAHKCHLSFLYLDAKRQATKKKHCLMQATADLLTSRQEQLKEARELMHRQLIMNAFVTSDLSWDATKYVKDGIPQGWFRNTEIIASQLRKHHEDSQDGVYRLRLTWVPAEGATAYPATIQIDRIADEHFALENIVWRACPTADEETFRDFFSLKTMQIEATIRCRFVAHFQCAERVERETAEIAEEKYKQSLPLWKRISYKPGDYQKAQAEKGKNESQTSNN
ncbi:hypothetical protein PWT90_09616 [Aphanocladium album]|nr:hypothetical protein PWT90_09616 [Aphanocladium album]